MDKIHKSRYLAKLQKLGCEIKTLNHEICHRITIPCNQPSEVHRYLDIFIDYIYSQQMDDKRPSNLKKNESR